MRLVFVRHLSEEKQNKNNNKKNKNQKSPPQKKTRKNPHKLPRQQKQTQ